jgi:hypothetical protein
LKTASTSRTSIPHHAGSLKLGHIAVDGFGYKALVGQLLHQFIYPHFGVAEGHTTGKSMVPDEAEEDLGLILGVHIEAMLADIGHSGI